jgi:hypothetical protein
VAHSSWTPKANTKAEINSASISLNEIRSMGSILLRDSGHSSASDLRPCDSFLQTLERASI